MRAHPGPLPLPLPRQLLLLALLPRLLLLLLLLLLQLDSETTHLDAHVPLCEGCSMIVMVEQHGMNTHAQCQQPIRTEHAHLPTMMTIATATQMAIPSIHSPSLRCSSSAAPNTVDTCHNTKHTWSAPSPQDRTVCVGGE